MTGYRGHGLAASSTETKKDCRVPAGEMNWLLGEARVIRPVSYTPPMPRNCLNRAPNVDWEFKNTCLFKWGKRERERE